MSGMLTGPVVVGVDGSEASLAAVRYAASEAVRAQVPLRIVHVLPSFIPMSPMLPLSSLDTAREVGERIVEAARNEAEKAEGQRLPVTTVVAEGGRVPALVGETQDARLIVLGHADSRGGQFFTGRTLTGVATRAACPVVAVPSRWRPVRGTIVVGVTDVDSAHEVLAAAFERAAASGESLLLVHAWKVDSAYEDIIFERVQRDEIRRTAQEAIGRAIAELRLARPEVAVEIEVVHDGAASAIVSRSANASLVMLGRRSRHGYPGYHLGTTTRAVLHHATCPIEVVPVSAADRGAEREGDVTARENEASLA